MPRYIVKIPNTEDPARPWYCEYSTIVDAICVRYDSLDELRQYYLEEEGRKGARELEERLTRVEAKGTSAFNDASAEDTVSCNRMYEGDDRFRTEGNETYPDHSMTWDEVVAYVNSLTDDPE